jgi:hypothetical protein
MVSVFLGLDAALVSNPVRDGRAIATDDYIRYWVDRSTFPSNG